MDRSSAQPATRALRGGARRARLGPGSTRTPRDRTLRPRRARRSLRRRPGAPRPEDDADPLSSDPYRRLESIWSAGEVVILDGGVGSELQRVGFPRDRNIGELWGTVALLEAPDLAEEVHRRYVAAGADVITTHTWRIDAVEPGRTLRDTARRAVEIAREAADALGRPETAVAFSVWPEPLEPAFTAGLADAIAEACPDLILAETSETIRDDLRFPP